MTQWELMMLFQRYDGEVDIADFTEEELNELLECKTEEDFKSKYFGYYDDVKSSSLKKQDW